MLHLITSIENIFDLDLNSDNLNFQFHEEIREQSLASTYYLHCKLWGHDFTTLHTDIYLTEQISQIFVLQTMSNTKRLLVYIVPVTVLSFALNTPKFMEVTLTKNNGTNEVNI